jgi:hypothetical protein
MDSLREVLGRDADGRRHRGRKGHQPVPWKDAGRSRAVRRVEPDRGRKGRHAGALERRGSVLRGSPRGATPRRAVTTDGPNGPHGGPSCDGGAPSDRTHHLGRLDPRIGAPAGSGSPGLASLSGCRGAAPRPDGGSGHLGAPAPRQLEGRVLGPEPTAGTAIRRGGVRLVRLGGQQRTAADDRESTGTSRPVPRRPETRGRPSPLPRPSGRIGETE